MADSMMLSRRLIRLAALEALGGVAFAGVCIESPGDWSTPPEALPSILLRSTDERKESITRGAAEFTTTISIEIEARVGAEDASTAQDAIEALCYAIESALLTNYGLIAIVNQVVSFDTKMEISSDGKIHFGGARMTINFEVPEMYDAFLLAAPPALMSFGLHFDAASPFDSTGTYASPFFPATAAPRRSGPDGRDEGFIDITLPQ